MSASLRSVLYPVGRRRRPTAKWSSNHCFHFLASLSGIRDPLPHVVSPVNTTSSCDSEMSVTTGLLASFAKPWPFLRSSLCLLGSGLVCCSAASSCGVFVFGGGVGERRREGGVGQRRGELSSSHVDVARSSSRRWLGLGGGVGRVLGGNNMVRYGWMMGRSFFPSWKACIPSLKAAPAIVPQSTFVPSYVASTTPALCFGIPYSLTCTHPTSSKNFATSLKKGSGISLVWKALADKDYLP